MTGLPDGEVAAALRGSRLFATLPEDDIRVVLQTSRAWELARGQVLMAEGAPPDAMYVILSGEFEVSRNVGGSDVLLNVCMPGELVGELGIAHGRPRSATVRARVDSRVQRIGAEVLDTI